VLSVTVISSTCQEFLGKRYYLCGKYYQHKGKRLHVAVWTHLHGPVPKGWHVHHVDTDRSNNRPDNLEAKPKAAHLSDHMTPERRAAASAWAAVIRPMTAAWHRSEAGKAWHSANARRAWAKREPVRRACDHCGAAFESITHRSSDRFCSNKCKSAWRRASGVDNCTAVCAWCQGFFTTHKYSQAETCSNACAQRRRRHEEATSR
jgi:hypothetical protein